jgi:hypothetical protein
VLELPVQAERGAGLAVVVAMLTSETGLIILIPFDRVPEKEKVKLDHYV